MNPMNDSNGSIQLVVFDLGGVLVQVVDSFTRAFGKAGVALPQSLRDESTRRAVGDINRRAEMGEIDARGFAEAAANLLQLEIDHMHRVLTCWLEGPYPGAGELLRNLAARNIATACLSNTNDHHWQAMTAPAGFGELNLAELKHHFASHHLRLAKPDPAIYAHVEQKTGTAPGRILFFDDLAVNCEGARRRGWHACQIKPDGNPVEQIDAELSRLRVL